MSVETRIDPEDINRVGRGPGERARQCLRLLRNLAIDLRYGGFEGGSISNRHRGATAVGSTDYGVMKEIFRDRIREADVLVEVGCGKGRVINWWLSRGLKNRIVGLEIMEEVAERTRRRLRRFPNVTILGGDALANLPPDGTLFYMANPFDAANTRRFKERMAGICEASPDVRILYYTCVHVNVFRDDPAWSVEEVKVSRPALAKVFEERHTRLALIRHAGATAGVQRGGR